MNIKQELKSLKAKLRAFEVQTGCDLGHNQLETIINELDEGNFAETDGCKIIGYQYCQPTVRDWVNCSSMEVDLLNSSNFKTRVVVGWEL